MAFSDESGKPVRLLGAQRELTRFKRAEEMLEQKTEALRYFGFKFELRNS